jgi:hypothetical protein
MSTKKDHPRFIIADVFCPQIFDLLCVHDSVRHPPAVDAIGAIEEPGRGQFKAEALKLHYECVNVEFRHGDEDTRGERESEGLVDGSAMSEGKKVERRNGLHAARTFRT